MVVDDEIRIRVLGFVIGLVETRKETNKGNAINLIWKTGTQIKSKTRARHKKKSKQKNIV